MPKKTPPAANNFDIRLLMDEIGKLYDANARGKTEIVEETKRHFDVTVEHIRTELRGAKKDEIEGIKIRVTRLEQHVGIAG